MAGRTEGTHGARFGGTIPYLYKVIKKMTILLQVLQMANFGQKMVD